MALEVKLVLCVGVGLVQRSNSSPTSTGGAPNLQVFVVRTDETSKSIKPTFRSFDIRFVALSESLLTFTEWINAFSVYLLQ